MRRCAEHKNHYYSLSTFEVIAIWTMNIAISTMYLCPLCKLKAVQDVIMKFLQKCKAPWDNM